MGDPRDHDAVPGNFDAFRTWIVDRPEIMAELSGATDLRSFATRVIAVGERHGFAFAAEEVETAWQQVRRAWAERDQP